MNSRLTGMVGTLAALALATPTHGIAQSATSQNPNTVKHVLLISVDGMHAVDFLNCAHGITGVNGGAPYCPTLAALGRRGVNYVAASTSKPSDSFPGLMAIVSGSTPKTMGVYYDVAYDRSLDAPATTGNGVAGGPCTAYGQPTGTTTEYEEGIDIDKTKLNGGAPGASLTDGGIASIDPKKLPRNPAAGCAPVYPWNFMRTNTVFGVIHAAGGYTAWADKHPAYSSVAGPGGTSVDDFYAPEINSTVVALPGVQTATGASCTAIRDTSGDLTAWTNSFQNIQCYDTLKVDAILNQIAGKTHSGASAQVPALFGMNFQAVSVGQKLIEGSTGTGGYTNAEGAPTAPLLSEIEYVDASIGQMVQALKASGNFDETLIIITAKHGQSPIDSATYKPNGTITPATLIASELPDSESPANPNGIGATEDDVSLLWLKQGASVKDAVSVLEQNAEGIGLGQIFYGPSLAINYNVGGLEPGQDPRSPDIIVTPNVGVTYSNSKAKLSEHGGFSHDDTNVVLLLASPKLLPKTVTIPTATAQVAPTILTALGLDAGQLQGVQLEGTPILPGLVVIK